MACLSECEGVRFGFEEGGCGPSFEAVRTTELGDGKKRRIFVVDDRGIGSVCFWGGEKSALGSGGGEGSKEA